MALTDMFAARPATNILTRLAKIFDTPFDARARRNARRIEALRGMSDGELQRMGLNREDIVPYVLGVPRSRR